jgi:multiple sugar transport system substrate-binding protein
MYAPISSENDRAQWAAYVSLGKKELASLDVKVDGPNFVDYWTKAKTQLSGSDAPCILYTQAARTQEIGSLLMPLDDLIKKNHVDTSGLDASMLKGMTVDGTVRALPYDAEPMVMFYNADAFTKAGRPLPGKTYTRRQFLADAKALTKPGRFALGTSSGMFFDNAWATAGDATWLKDGKLDLTNQKFVDETQWYFDLAAKEKITKAPEAADNSEAVQQAFIAGDVDMVVEGPWQYGAFAKGAKFKLGVTIVPTESGQAHGMTAGSGFGIAANCKRPDDAFAAITAMTSESVVAKQAADRGIVPSRVSALPSWAKGKTPQAAEVVGALLNRADAQLTTSTWNQVETQFTQSQVQGFRGQKSAQEILTGIQNQVGG